MTATPEPVAAFCHQLVELGPVPCVLQPIKEIAELALFLFEPAQRLSAVLVKGARMPLHPG
jgi:hypothetical protein